MDVLLPDDECVLDGKSQPQHDEVGICSVEAVGIVRQEVILVSSHELHNFVLSFSGSVRASEDYTKAFPVVVLIDFFLDEEMQHFVELLHEGSSWRD